MANVVKNKLKKIMGNYSAFERKKFLFVYLLIAFPVIQMAVFWFYVNLSGIIMAFQDAQGRFSMESFKEVKAILFDGKLSMGFNVPQLLGKSVFIWIMNHVVIQIISILSCFILTKHMVGHKFFRTCYMIPGLLGTVVFVSIMQEFYADDGVIVSLCQTLKIDLPTTISRNGFLGDESTAFPTLMVQMFVWNLTGGGLILAGAYMRIPQEIFESASLDGCGFFREAFQIAVPCVWPTLSTMMIFALTSFFTADFSTYLYSGGTGARGINSIGYYTYDLKLKISRGGVEYYSFCSAFGVALTIMTLPIVFFGRWLLAKFNDPVEF